MRVQSRPRMESVYGTASGRQEGGNTHPSTGNGDQGQSAQRAFVGAYWKDMPVGEAQF